MSDAKTEKAIAVVMAQGNTRPKAETIVKQFGADRFLSLPSSSAAERSGQTHSAGSGAVGNTGKHGKLGSNAAK
jgi:hypothetical protein